MYSYNTELYHHGVKGQKWVVRKYRNEDGSLTPAGKRKLKKEAGKDAKEYARAKMYYGKGAGTRRKLIKAHVQEKSNDPIYKDAFDKALSEQNMDDHAFKAKTERKRADRKEFAGKTARGVYHTIAKDGAAVSAFVASSAATLGVVATVMHATGADKVVIDKGKRYINKLIKNRPRVFNYK